LANNQYAYSTPNGRQFACESLADKAAGYGIDVCSIDGTDLRACLDATEKAVNRARAGGGPQLVVADLLRLCGHGEHDDGSYIPADLKASPVGRDCLKVAESYLLGQGWADAGTLSDWRRATVLQVEEGVAKVQREAPPDPYKEDWSALASKHLSEGVDLNS